MRVTEAQVSECPLDKEYPVDGNPHNMKQTKQYKNSTRDASNGHDLNWAWGFILIVTMHLLFQPFLQSHQDVIFIRVLLQELSECLFSF